MKCRYQYSGLLFSILFFVSFTSASANFRLSDDQIKSATKKVADSLQLLEKCEKTTRNSGAKITPRTLNFDKMTGWYLSLRSAKASADISILNERMFSICLNENRLPSYSPLNKNNRMITFDTIVRENTRIELDAARRTAEAAARTLFGEHILDKLQEIRGEPARTGNRFGYVFKWKKGEPSLVGPLGFDNISVWINPQTGRLYSITRYRYDPPTPEISAEEARRVVSDVLAQEEFPFKIVSLILIDRYEESGLVHPTWLVEARQKRPNPFGSDAVVRVIEIDATSGTISVDPQYETPVSIDLSSK